MGTKYNSMNSGPELLLLEEFTELQLLTLGRPENFQCFAIEASEFPQKDARVLPAVRFFF